MSLFDEMCNKGIPCPPEFNPLKNGFHRYGKNSRYWLRLFNGMAFFGDHLTGESHKWHASGIAPQGNILPECKELYKHQKLEREHSLAEIALKCDSEWNALSEVGSSSYLIRKQVSAFGVRFYYDWVVVPIRDVYGKLWSLQYIHNTGFKRFIKGGKKRGHFHTIGKISNSVVVGEGYATLASIHMATAATCIVAFDAGNIEPVIEVLKHKHPHLSITIAADDDRWKPEIGNIGRIKANEAAKRHGCITALPVFNETSSKPTDWNDLHILEGLHVVKTQLMEIISC